MADKSQPLTAFEENAIGNLKAATEHLQAAVKSIDHHRRQYPERPLNEKIVSHFGEIHTVTEYQFDVLAAKTNKENPHEKTEGRK